MKAFFETVIAIVGMGFALWLIASAGVKYEFKIAGSKYCFAVGGMPKWERYNLEGDRYLKCTPVENDFYVVFARQINNFDDSLFLFKKLEREGFRYDSVDFKLGARLGDSSMYIIIFFGLSTYTGKSHYDKFVVTSDHYKWDCEGCDTMRSSINIPHYVSEIMPLINRKNDVPFTYGKNPF